MKKKNIYGKRFFCCEFKSCPRLTYDHRYEELVGQEAIVLETNDALPDYTEVKVGLESAQRTWYFPTEVIEKQIEERENQPLDVYFDKVRNILRTI